MKKLLYILLLMVTAGIVGCQRPSETEARLIAIDSLIAVSPDSALTLLEAIGPRAGGGSPHTIWADASGSPDTRKSHADAADYRDRLPASRMTRSERAYHALLTCQALYKAYIPATSDSLINIAWNYYEDHGSYDRRIRAMLYKGTTAEELGQPDSAMRWYKRTELESRPDDHYHRGYALMQMAVLYQGVYETRHAINKYRYAIDEFEEHDETANILFCSYQLSRIYQLVTPDSSVYFLNKVDSIAQSNNDTTYIIAAKTTLSAKEFYKYKYAAAKNAALDVINRFPGLVPFECWHYASCSYSKLGLKDSALYYFKESPSPSCAKDSVLYFESRKALDALQGNWIEALKNDSIVTAVTDAEIEVVHSNGLFRIENEAEKQWLSNQFGLRIFKSVLLLSVVFIIVVLLVNYLRHRHELKRFSLFVNQLEYLNSILQGEQNEIQTISVFSKYSLNQRIEYCSTLLKSLQSYSTKLIDENGFIKASFIDMANVLQSSKLEATRTIQELESEIRILKDNLANTDSTSEKQILLEQVGELENERIILTDNCKLLKCEVDNLQSSIAPLSDVFRTILAAVRKKDSRQLDEAIKGIMTDSFFNHVYQYVNYTHHQLFSEIQESGQLTKNEVNIVCMYLCHLPDTIIKIYANLTNVRSVNKLKKTISQKLNADGKKSLKSLRKF